MIGCAVKYAVLPHDRIFNLTSPRYLPEISLRWSGKYHWHHGRYDKLRDEIESLYIQRFNEVSGHYDRLLESIQKDGFRNPIMVSAGKLQRRKAHELPPALRQDERLIVSEYLGGSRLWAAQRLGIDVPCIVNDFADVVEGRELGSEDAVASYFTDRPRLIRFSTYKGVVCNDIPFMHLPEAERYSLEQQIIIRRGIVAECKQKVAEWLETYDR